MWLVPAHVVWLLGGVDLFPMFFAWLAVILDVI
jgi:hypothetical protein